MIKPTGKHRYRVTPEGLVVLQVQERNVIGGRDLPDPSSQPTWRDAKVEDLSEHQGQA